MLKDEINSIIKNEAEYFGWSYEEAVNSLKNLGLSVEDIQDNELFDEPKIRNSVAMAYHAFG